jgi:hypothetical protein
MTIHRNTRRAVTLLGIATSVLAAACSSPGSGQESTESTNSALSATEQTAFDFFVAKGLSNVQAAGIIGNLMQESNVDPTAVQAGGPGRGIAQWSVGGRWDTDSRDNVAWYAGTQGASEWSLGLQLDFIWYELATFPGYGLASLRGSSNVTDATIAFETDFEGCGECDQGNRIAYAEAALSAYGGAPTPVPPEPTACGAIEPGHGLKAGESWRSCDGRFELAMQTDGNLVWYGPSGALWDTATNGHGGYVAIMQTDGNFVEYGASSNALWSSGSSGHAGAWLALQTDGNLVVYEGSTALWDTGTEGK